MLKQQPGLAVFAWAVVVLVAAGLRLWQIDLQLLIDDEWHAIHRLMQAGYREILLSMGHADYSIPLTLLFRWLAEQFVLNDVLLRLLPLTFGIATVVLVPVLLSPWLDRRQCLVLAALLAISPLLIHFSRYVRPYSLTVLLNFSAMILLWRWWQEGGRGKAAGFAVTATLSAWLHALTTLFVGAGLVWITVLAVVRWIRGGGSRDLWRILALGGLTTAACCLLVLPPLLSDPHSIAVKAGKQYIEAQTLLRSWELILGVGSPWLAAVLVVPVLLGVWKLLLQAPGFLGYWMWQIVAAVAALALIGPEWIHHALVLVRYSAIAQPFVLALLAIGVVVIGDKLLQTMAVELRSVVVAGSALAVAAGLYLSGPLPEIYRGINQFTNSVRYQIDYDFERNVYHELMGHLELPEAYRRMMAVPGHWEIVEAAWHFESHNSPIHQYQLEHNLPIRIGMISGLCTDWTWGEINPDSDLHIRLARMQFLSDLIEQGPDQNLFVVFHHQAHFDRSRPLPDTSACVSAFRELFGAPWHESVEQTVFRLEAAVRADAS